MSLSLFGLGLGWNLAFVAATTQLVTLAAPSERGRLIGFSDLTLELHRRGASRSPAESSTRRADPCRSPSSAAALAALPALWILLLPSPVGVRLVRRFSV